MYNTNSSCRKGRVRLANSNKTEVSKLRIEVLINTVFKFIGIVIFAKQLLDWYIDYRIDNKHKENKNRRYSGKNERR